MKKYIACLTLVLSILAFGIAIADDDPTIKFYDSYVESFMNAKSLDEIKPYLAKKNIAEIGELAKEDEEFLLELGKDMRKSMKRKSISSKVEGEKATLSIEAVDSNNNSPCTGTITLIKEEGSWKVEKEEFECSAG